MTDSLDTSTLTNGFAGTVLKPDDAGYDEARAVWNGMIDRRPAVIARCASTADAVKAVQFGREQQLEIGVRGGGHSIVGHAVPDGGLMIDLSLMNDVRVDPQQRQAQVQGGALLGDLDRATDKHGLAVTGGNVSHTGVGGYTLAGGTGWLARELGLACDNILSYELVTASGEVLRVSETEHPDLFWGLKGGGGNFGVVTEFVFRLHPISGQTFSLDLFYPVDVAAEPLAHWRDLIKTAPREATLTAWCGTAGEWPFLPAQFHGQSIVRIGYVWVGEVEEGQAWQKTFRSQHAPIAEDSKEMPYVKLQSLDDDTLQEHGLRRYWRGHYFRELPEQAIHAFLARGAADPTLKEEAPYLPGASMYSYGGAIADVANDATAFSHRDDIIELVIGTRWSDPAEDEQRMALARRYAAALEPFSSGAYVNTAATEGQAGTARLYGPAKLARLAALKQKYDPENLFHNNANIPPAPEQT